MRSSGGRGREDGTPSVHRMITGGKGGVGRGEPPFGNLRANSGDANPGVLKRVCRDIRMGSQAEVEVDRCSLLAADVSSFGVNVFSFRPDVFTFRATVFSFCPYLPRCVHFPGRCVHPGLTTQATRSGTIDCGAA